MNPSTKRILNNNIYRAASAVRSGIARVLCRTSLQTHSSRGIGWHYIADQAGLFQITGDGQILGKINLFQSVGLVVSILYNELYNVWHILLLNKYRLF